MRTVDVGVLQENLEHITFADIGESEAGSPTNFIQLFRLAQLTIEFLLHVQNLLLHKSEEVRSIVRIV